MELNFYSLSVLYLVYSFLGWVGETVVATIKGRRFANRGVASGPFCFIYGYFLCRPARPAAAVSGLRH